MKTEIMWVNLVNIKGHMKRDMLDVHKKMLLNNMSHGCINLSTQMNAFSQATVIYYIKSSR